MLGIGATDAEGAGLDMTTIEFKPLVDALFQVGEGPVYDERRDALWFCDIVGRELHRVAFPSLEARKWDFPSEVCSLGMAESGKLVIALRNEVGLFDPDSDDYQTLAAIEADNADTRLNDGKVGPDGAFWVGTMDDGDRPVKEPIAALYRVDAAGKVERKVDGLLVSNGLAFSPDGTLMFHSDSRGAWIDRWRFDKATGAISERKRLAVLDEETGRPDGGATDAEGCYWSAGVSAARLNRFSSEGRLLESFPVPVAAPSMPCFGGPGLRRLFVTSIRAGRSKELLDRYPLTGSVLVADAPVAGAPVTRFRDV
jgi:sugar lactone lactonase YvrE